MHLINSSTPHSLRALPNASMTCTGSTSKGRSQYSANMQHTVLSTTLALVRSVAVHSMKMSRVSSVICPGYGVQGLERKTSIPYF